MRTRWRILMPRLPCVRCATSPICMSGGSTRSTSNSVSTWSRRDMICHSFWRRLLPASNVAEVLNGVEPPYYAYQRTENALQAYLALADQDIPLPEVQKTMSPGNPYAGSEALAQRLELLGDLPKTRAVGLTPGHLRRRVGRRSEAFSNPARVRSGRQTEQRYAAPAEYAVERSRPAAGRCFGEVEMAAGRFFTTACWGEHT